VRRQPFLLLAAVTACLACDRKPMPKAGDLQGEVAMLVPKVEKAAGLTFRRPPKVESTTSTKVQAFLIAQFEKPELRKSLDEKIVVWKRIGVVPDTTDVVALLTRLLTEQVVGYYDPKSKTLFVVEGRAGVERETVLRHELTHALQDQYVNLDSLQSLDQADDRVGAAQAVLEGHATVMMIGNAARTIAWDKARDGIRDARASSPLFSGAPGFVAEGLLFPYLAGAEFVRGVMGDGASSADLLANLPSGTSQILHKERWGPKGNAPEVVGFTLAPGVTTRYVNNFGEFETRLLLAELLGDVARASRAATGMDGDTYVLLSVGAAGVGQAWMSVWDSPVDAEDFAEAVGAAMAKRYESAVLTRNGRREIVAAGRRVSVRTDRADGRDIVVVEDLPAAVPAPILAVASVTVGAK